MNGVQETEELFDGAFEPRHNEVSIRLLELRSQNGEPHAVGAIGALLVEGQVVEADTARGWAMIEWAASEGNFRSAVRMVLRNCHAPRTPQADAVRIYWTRILVQSMHARRRGYGSTGSPRAKVIPLAPGGKREPVST